MRNSAALGQAEVKWMRTRPALLEDMVRALCRGGERLHAIDRLGTRLVSTAA